MADAQTLRGIAEREDGLLSCPFCGAGETIIREKRMPPSMSGADGALISVDVQHFCERVPGILGRSSIVFAGRDHASALNAWNRRALAASQEQRRG